MIKPARAFAIDHGTLHLELDVDLRTLAAVIAFMALFALEVAIMFLVGQGDDATTRLLFTT